MTILIDGHNLIGKLSGMDLRDPEDEMKLVQMLQVYCRVRQRKVEVYFDGSPPGFAGQRRFGQVTAHFISDRIQADDAIIQRLQRMGRRARNCTIITSDRRIQAQAKSSQAKVIPSEVFVDELIEARRLSFDHPTGEMESGLSADELDEWLRLFEDKD